MSIQNLPKINSESLARMGFSRLEFTDGFAIQESCSEKPRLHLTKDGYLLHTILRADAVVIVDFLTKFLNGELL